MFFNAFLDLIFMRTLLKNEAKMTSKTIQKSVRSLIIFWIDF